MKKIEVPKNNKSKYVIKVNNEDKEYFPEDVQSVILQYLKKIAMNFENNENIKKVIITVSAHFNDLKRTSNNRSYK